MEVCQALPPSALLVDAFNDAPQARVAEPSQFVALAHVRVGLRGLDNKVVDALVPDPCQRHIAHVTGQNVARQAPPRLCHGAVAAVASGVLICINAAAGEFAVP